MEENTTGQEETQNPQGEEQTSQNNQEKEDAFKVYSSENEWTKEMDSRFKNAYNQHRDKALKDLNSLGIEADNYDDAINILSSKLSSEQKEANKAEQPSGESDELREKINEWKSKYEQTQSELEQTRLSQAVNKDLNDAFSRLDSEGSMKLSKDKVEALFRSDRDIKQEDGKVYASYKDGRPVLDDEGNRMTLSESIYNYAKSEELWSPNKKGTGGSTGDSSVAGEKPKKSEWRKLLVKSDPTSQQLAATMFNHAKEVGWAE